jgi:hypothetical protein
MSADNYDDMPITKVLKEWMVAKEWDDEIQLSENRRSSRVSTTYNINNQSYRTFIDIDEDDQWFSVFMYSPFSVPISRISEMARALNKINYNNQKVGRIACPDEDEPGPVQFRWTTDLSNGSISKEQIDYMVETPVGFFNFFGEVLAAIALTKAPAESLMAEFWEEKGRENANDADDEDDVPSEL